MDNPTYEDFLDDLEPIELPPETSEDDRECEICYGPFEQPIRLPCGHIFCNACLLRALIPRNFCPKCRRVLFKKRPFQLGQEEARHDIFTPEEERARLEQARSNVGSSRGAAASRGSTRGVFGGQTRGGFGDPPRAPFGNYRGSHRGGARHRAAGLSQRARSPRTAAQLEADYEQILAGEPRPATSDGVRQLNEQELDAQLASLRGGRERNEASQGGAGADLGGFGHYTGPFNGDDLADFL
ncbi:putative Zinc finger, RING-type [Septoria linicola]|nr:putative Zinc finger, RING-type [Septoria linicola]